MVVSEHASVSQSVGPSVSPEKRQDKRERKNSLGKDAHVSGARVPGGVRMSDRWELNSSFLRVSGGGNVLTDSLFVKK